jgi:hypothetical protein
MNGEFVPEINVQQRNEIRHLKIGTVNEHGLDKSDSCDFPKLQRFGRLPLKKKTFLMIDRKTYLLYIKGRQCRQRSGEWSRANIRNVGDVIPERELFGVLFFHAERLITASLNNTSIGIFGNGGQNS